ncbi:MAG: right-handed parallel beta-helix repeat-containing protein [Trueperaceae bacterium]|nr:right-handed parallel beta-helix repeat-containing protein [Trueperaceae bacterium]
MSRLVARRRFIAGAASVVAAAAGGGGIAARVARDGGLAHPRRAQNDGAPAREVEVQPGESIQAAVDRATPGAVVRIPPGTYQETVVIEKPLALIGAGYRRTTLVADRGRFRWAGLARERYVVGAVNVRNTRNVLIAGMTVQGALEGVWVSASRYVTISDCMSCAHDSSGYYLWGSVACTVVRSEGSDCAVGIYQGGSVDIRIARNVFRRNRGGRVPHLDDDDYPGIGLLMGNLSRGCRVEGNLLAENTDWGMGVSLGVHEVSTLGNTIRDNPTGVFVGERGLRMRADNVAGNADWGVDSAAEVDAREVWWGAPDGPSGAGPGRGDAVRAPVLVTPWRRAPSRLAQVGPRARPPMVGEGATEG